MQMKQLLVDRIDGNLRSSEETMRALTEFVKNVPGEVLACEMEASEANRRAVMVGDQIYKFGLHPESTLAFIEVFDDREQTEPTMALYIDSAEPSAKIIGKSGGRAFTLRFFVSGEGTVEKTMQLD
ncbi:MAG: hypothetical protein HFK09_06550 [Clostridia bacterium]|nr:hypothetical protein [Clostridia bacterium]